MAEHFTPQDGWEPDITSKARRCAAEVHRRDTYRRCGGKQHFKMHYARGQCKHKAVEGSDLCGLHRKQEQLAEIGYTRYPVSRVANPILDWRY